MLRLSLKIATALIALIILGAARPAAAQTAVKISEVLHDPKVYNEHEIAAFGQVRGLTITGQYVTFMICKSRCLNVLAWGHPRISNGQALNVRGRFHLIREINHQKVRNVIEIEHDNLGFSPDWAPRTPADTTAWTG
jgi:hypothetical protein